MHAAVARGAEHDEGHVGVRARAPQVARLDLHLVLHRPARALAPGLQPHLPVRFLDERPVGAEVPAAGVDVHELDEGEPPGGPEQAAQDARGALLGVEADLDRLELAEVLGAEVEQELVGAVALEVVRGGLEPPLAARPLGAVQHDRDVRVRARPALVQRPHADPPRLFASVLPRLQRAGGQLVPVALVQPLVAQKEPALLGGEVDDLDVLEVPGGGEAAAVVADGERRHAPHVHAVDRELVPPPALEVVLGVLQLEGRRGGRLPRQDARHARVRPRAPQVARVHRDLVPRQRPLHVALCVHREQHLTGLVRGLRLREPLVAREGELLARVDAEDFDLAQVPRRADARVVVADDAPLDRPHVGALDREHVRLPALEVVLRVAQRVGAAPAPVPVELDGHVGVAARELDVAGVHGDLVLADLLGRVPHRHRQLPLRAAVALPAVEPLIAGEVEVLPRGLVLDLHVVQVPPRAEPAVHQSASSASRQSREGPVSFSLSRSPRTPTCCRGRS